MVKEIMTEKMNSKKSIKANNVVKLGLFLLVLSILVSIISLTPKIKAELPKVFQKIKEDKGKTPISPSQMSPAPSERLNHYENKEFGFSVLYPQTLNKNDMGAQGGYSEFVRFEETNFSTQKGFAIGVSSLPLNYEIERIKQGFKKEGGAELKRESDVEFKGFVAKSLYYIPTNPKEEEERVVIIFNTGKYTYSISSIPDQIDKVKTWFSLLQSN